MPRCVIASSAHRRLRADPRPGLSFRTQALYLLVFVTRYIDLFFRYVSLYNSLMKVFFIASSAYIIYLMRVKYRSVAPLPPITPPP